jgi:peroxygenase
MFVQRNKGCLRTVIALFVAVVLQATTSGAERTALQKHSDFFDINGDNYVSPGESYKRMKELGLSTASASFFSYTISLIGPFTNPKWYAPFSINLKYIARGQHTSATRIFGGPNGEVVKELKKSKFELFDVDEDGTLSTSEVKAMVKANAQNFADRVRADGEFFGLLFPVAGEDRVLEDYSTERFITKETWDKFYDGTLFFHLVGKTPPWE